MNKSPIELSNYINASDYYKHKNWFKNKGVSLRFDIETGIKKPYYYNDTFSFRFEFCKLAMIAKAKIPVYIHLYDGLVAKRVSDSGNGKWQRLYIDKNKHGNDCAVWLPSCCDDDYYLGEQEAWVQVTFNEALLTEQQPTDHFAMGTPSVAHAGNESELLSEIGFDDTECKVTKRVVYDKPIAVQDGKNGDL